MVAVGVSVTAAGVAAGVASAAIRDGVASASPVVVAVIGINVRVSVGSGKSVSVVVREGSTGGVTKSTEAVVVFSMPAVTGGVAVVLTDVCVLGSWFSRTGTGKLSAGLPVPIMLGVAAGGAWGTAGGAAGIVNGSLAGAACGGVAGDGAAVGGGAGASAGGDNDAGGWLGARMPCWLAAGVAPASTEGGALGYVGPFGGGGGCSGGACERGAGACGDGAGPGAAGVDDDGGAVWNGPGTITWGIVG